MTATTGKGTLMGKGNAATLVDIPAFFPRGAMTEFASTKAAQLEVLQRSMVALKTRCQWADNLSTITVNDIIRDLLPVLVTARAVITDTPTPVKAAGNSEWSGNMNTVTTGIQDGVDAVFTYIRTLRTVGGYLETVDVGTDGAITQKALTGTQKTALDLLLADIITALS